MKEPKINVYRTLHPLPKLAGNSKVQQSIRSALKNQDAEQFMSLFISWDKKTQSRVLQIAEAQFQVLKIILNNKNILISENSNSENCQQVLQSFGLTIREAFSHFPENFTDLTDLQRMILMMLPSYYTVAAINPGKILCPTMIGSEQELDDFLRQASTVWFNNENNPSKHVEEITRELDIIHAIVACVTNKIGEGLDIVVGQLHDTNYMRCLIGNSFTESFYPNKKEWQVRRGKHLSTDECKKDIKAFLQKWPSYQPLASFCLGNLSESEAQQIKSQYQGLCQSMTLPMRIEPSFTKQLASSSYLSFTSVFSDQYTESFESKSLGWLAWFGLQFCFIFLKELEGRDQGTENIINIITSVMLELLFLSIMRAMLQIASWSLHLVKENMPTPIKEKAEPIIAVTQTAALSAYTAYTVYSHPISAAIGIFSGLCSKKLVQRFVCPEKKSNENNAKHKMM